MSVIEVQPLRRRRQRMVLLFVVGVVLHLVTDDNLVIMVSSSSMADDNNDHQLSAFDDMRNATDPSPHNMSTDDDSLLPRGAAEALHDDALSQLPSLTSLQIGGLSNSNHHAIHGDADIFLPWNSATESYRRQGRNRKHLNISRLLLNCKARNATATNNATTTNNNATSSSGMAQQQHDDQSDLGAIQELIERAATTDRITNNSVPTSIITDDNTTPTTPIIVTEPSPTSVSMQTQENVIVLDEPPQPLDSTSTETSVNTTVDSTSTTSFQSDNEISSSTSTVEVDEEEDEEIGSVAVDYASKSAGAIILEKSHSFKGTSNLLNSDRDRYAIAPCQDKKYVVIGLSEDILVKTVKLANYERYSSHLKTFSIWGSQTTKEWVDLGTYEARFGLGEQSFNIQPSWARYLKFKFLTHYGSEYYCTISQIKVHGRTMVQGFHEQWSEAHDEEETEDAINETPLSGDHQQDSWSNNGNIKVSEMEPPSIEVVDSLAAADSVDKLTDGQDSKLLSSESSSSDTQVSQGASQEQSEEFHHELSTDDGDIEASNGTCDSLELFSSRCHHDVLQSASFVLSSTSRIIQASPSHTIPDISKGSFARTQSTPSTLSSHAQTLRDAAARSIGNSPLLSAAVERIQVVANALGDSLDINVSTLGRLGRKAEPDSQRVIEHESEVATSGDSITTLPTNAGPENSVSTDFNVEVPPPSSTSSSSDTDKTGEGSRHRQAAEEQSSQDHLQDLPPLVVHTLRRLPSADCLQKLNLGEFQAKMAATRKGGSKGPGATHAGNAIEPIFKTLTDQIRALQLTLSVHEQFTKSSASCYQRVLADLALEMESIRAANDARMMKLERDIQELKSTSLVVLSRNLVLIIASAMSFLARLVTELMVRVDVPFRILFSNLQPPAATTLALMVSLLILLAFLPSRPSRSEKSESPSADKRNRTQGSKKLEKEATNRNHFSARKAESVPDLVDSPQEVDRDQDESFAVLAQDSTSCTVRA